MLGELEARRTEWDDCGGGEDTRSPFNAILSESMDHLDGQLSDIATELVRVLHLANYLDHHVDCHGQPIVALKDHIILVALHQGVSDPGLGILLARHAASSEEDCQKYSRPNRHRGCLSVVGFLAVRGVKNNFDD